MKKDIPSRVLEGIADLVETYGHSADSIAARVGLEPEALYRPDLMLSARTINDLLEEAALVCGDRFFSLKLAQLQGWDVLGPIWLLIRRAQSVGEVLQLLADNLELHSEAMSAYMVKNDTGVSLCMEIRKLAALTPPPRHTGVVQVTELALAVCCYDVRRMLGSSWRPVYAQFRSAQPDVQAPLRQVFGENLFFNQDVNAIHVSHEDCNHPLRDKTDVSRYVIERELASTLGHGMPFVLRVDRIIRLLINGEGCTANQVADALNMKLRTLQYRLKQNQSSYQALYDAARLDLARHYLRKSDLSIAAVSERLSFTDCAAFSRFFKGRVGDSPRQYAKRARNEALTS